MSINSKCWNCSYTYEGFNFFCEKCKKIQKPIELDAFKTFKLKYNFKIDLKVLENNYFSLINKLHPDKFINNGDQEILYSQIHSSNINNCYNKLSDQISRADELLKCFGITINADESFNDEGLLNEVIEIQERAEKVSNSNDKKLLLLKLKDDIKNLFEDLSLMFEKKKFNEAIRIKIKISYLQKIVKNIEI